MIREIDDADGCPDCIQPPFTPFLPTFISGGLLLRLMEVLMLLSTAVDDNNLGNELASELSTFQSITLLIAAVSVEVRRYR